jgi:hypothetical protein
MLMGGVEYLDEGPADESTGTLSERPERDRKVGF